MIITKSHIYIKIFMLILCLAISIQSYAQVLVDSEKPQNVESDFYHIVFNKIESKENYIETLDSLYKMFNKVFQFTPIAENHRFRVILFAIEDEYKAYVRTKTGGVDVTTNAIYLRYTKIEDSEVVIFSENIHTEMGIRQLFLQYLSYYLPNYPQWLFGGYTLFFENQGVKENPWIETGKNLSETPGERLTLSQIITAEKSTYTVNRLFPQALLLVKFFEENADNTYRRMLFNGIDALKNGTEYDRAFLDYAEQWIGIHNADDAFSIYTSTLYTKNSALSEGIAQFTQNNIEKAQLNFFDVLAVDKTNSIAQYYLGLIAYDNKDYNTAKKWYLKALESGKNQAQINWALAVVSFGLEEYEQSLSFAQKAQELDPVKYTEQVKNLKNAIIAVQTPKIITE